MRDIEINAVKKWDKKGNNYYPQTVSIFCPCCNEKGTFFLRCFATDETNRTYTFASKCPTCDESVLFWIIEPSYNQDKEAYQFKSFILDPPIKEKRLPIKNVNEMPNRLNRAYLSTIESFNASLWDATAIMCRRTLEGILKDVLDKDATGKLYDQIKTLIKRKEIVKPLETLAHALREGGNLGAHFNSEYDTNYEIAKLMIDFIEYLLQYIYELPKSIEKLEEQIKALTVSNENELNKS